MAHLLIHNKRSVAIQVNFMFRRMTPKASAKMAERYAADSEGGIHRFWAAVADMANNHLNGRISHGEIEAQASLDTAAIAAAKDARPVATPNYTSTPEPSAEAKRVQAAVTEAEASGGDPYLAGMLAKDSVRLSESGKGADWVKEQTDKVATVAKHLKRKAEQAQLVLDTFKVEFNKSPIYALEWSRTVFEAAAQQSIFTRAWSRLTDESGQPQLYRQETDGMNIDNLRDYAQEEVNRRSRTPSQERSTSAQSNTLEREYLAAWSEVLEIIRWNA